MTHGIATGTAQDREMQGGLLKRKQDNESQRDPVPSLLFLFSFLFFIFVSFSICPVF